MERKQEREWAEAQKIVISKDLVAAAKQQLQFLAVVDRNQHLYDGPALYKAIYRYKYCWLPLLAKYAESEVSEGPLVVPLDCEWIWHCHRLNPVHYVTDCANLYGRILVNHNIVSSIQGICKKKTEEIWIKLYPEEPYELDMSSCLSHGSAKNNYATSESTKYNLVSAVRRQIPFFYQVSRSYMNDNLFLEGAVDRYKGFLHLIKRNRERSITRFCVPTYDIDLIWHSHQLHPASYCKDLVAIMGKVLEHDDTDSDRTKGQKLDVGFSETGKQWEETFGSRYWRAGAMYRGSAPSPLPTNLSQLQIQTGRKKVGQSDRNKNIIQLPKTTFVEVMLEIVAVKDLPTGHKGGLFVTFSKKQPDVFFKTGKRINISSESEQKAVSVVQCEPAGELVFELMSYSPSILSMSKTPTLLGTSTITLDDILNPVSKLQVEKWFQLTSNSAGPGSKPISIRIALSSTTPIPSPSVVHVVVKI
ncbi:glycine-rich domain-containing protein 1-like [Pyrus communis]|uniref:glycine-rich domain-containing protein 1-like n=1 Tax=Pyrus communis TaxID=23211 RepID=UPI0035C1D24E